jgi:hypothetical protein
MALVGLKVKDGKPRQKVNIAVRKLIAVLTRSVGFDIVY